MDKINVLFDASIIAESTVSNGARTGIFGVKYNILKQFLQNKNLNVDLYISNDLIGLFDQMKMAYPDLKNCNLWFKPNKKLYRLARKYQYFKTKNRRHNGSKIIRVFIKTALNLARRAIRIQEYFIERKLIKKYDVFFSCARKIPDFALTDKSIKKFTILHDAIPLIFPEYFDNRGTGWFMKMYKSINPNDYYFTVSNYTKSDFLKLNKKIDTNKTNVITLAASENFYPCTDAKKIKSAKEKYNIPTDKKYIFSLCSLEPRKNLIRTAISFIKFIEKHNLDDFVFILGGNAWKGFIEKMESEIPNFDKYRDKIIRAGYIDDADLAPLYSGSEFFVYTSEYEGFGLPPLEAMKCGKAVITSNNSSLPEVVGDAGIKIDFDSIDQHVESFEKLYFDLDLRSDMEKKSLARAKEFSWKKCADTIVNTMKRLQNV